MPRFFLRFARLTSARLVGAALALWLGVAALLAILHMPREWLLAYAGMTMIYSFFIAGWAMLRTYARLKGLLDEGEAPDGGLLLEALPAAAVALDGRGKVRALNGRWLEVFEMPRNQVHNKRYDHFCDPVLRRHIARAFRTGDSAADLRLSTRTPDGGNVFFRADIAPLGEGWLVCARPASADEMAPPGSLARERLCLLGQATAAWAPRLRLNAADGGADATSLARLPALLAPLANLASGLDDEAAKPLALDPAELLAEAARLVEPAFAAKGVALEPPPAAKLPEIVGHRPQLVFMLAAMFFAALDETPAGEKATMTAHKAGEDVEIAIAYPAAEPSPDPFDPTARTPNLAAARQIARRHDGELRRLPPADGCRRFVLQLPTAQALQE